MASNERWWTAFQISAFPRGSSAVIAVQLNTKRNAPITWLVALVTASFHTGLLASLQPELVAKSHRAERQGILVWC